MAGTAGCIAAKATLHRCDLSQSTPAPACAGRVALWLQAGLVRSTYAGAPTSPAPCRPWGRSPRRLRLRRCRVGRGAVDGHGAADVAGLEGAEALLVAVVHDGVGAGRVVQPDGVADLVRQGVAQVVGLEVAVEAHLPGPRRIEADERLADRLHR